MSRFLERYLLACALALAIFSPAYAQDNFTVTLTVENVQSSAGNVLAGLCDDPTARIPGPCRTYSAKAPAKPGATVLIFTGVKPGTYAIQVLHDQNSNGVLDFPQEAYAFGNDSGFPPSFKAASITVSGDTKATVHLVNTFSNGTGMNGTKGADASADVTKTDLREGGLYGELYVPRHSEKLPLVIAIGGSEGGLDTISAFTVPLAAHGYAVLALAYWKEPGLPQSLEGIPLEYFDRAVTWARSQPQIAPERIALLGWSRGAEAALLVAGRNSNIHAVIAVSPTAYVWQGLNFTNPALSKPAFTVGGVPLPSIIPANGRPGEQMTQMFVDKLDEAERRPETAIPVEKIAGPLLLISGSDDGLGPSNLMSERIVARLKANHFRYEVVHRNFDGAGHATFTGDPLTQKIDTTATDKLMGGSAEANAKARAQSWPLVLDFLSKSLR